MARLRLVFLSVSFVLTGSVFIGYLHLSEFQNLSAGDLLDQGSESHGLHGNNRSASDTVLEEELQSVPPIDPVTNSQRNRLVDTMLLIHMVSVLCFVAICVAHAVRVETQMYRRISRLSAALDSFAKDETATSFDITEHDDFGWMGEAVDTFRANAEELRRSNRELEKFAYVAAHDLRSPLRAIQDLAEWTMEDEANSLSDESRENMALLQKRVDRLNLLLSDLLTYARVGRDGDGIGPVSIGQVVDTTMELLDPNGQFDIGYVGTTQDVVTHATPLRLALMNLIGNSIKHHDASRGTIRVTANVVGDRLHVSVQDDGPGIDPRYHERVFGLFQTLRPRDEVEGSGLGLAIIRKLVEHHGGSILLTSDPTDARGAKFEFDLPTATRAICQRTIAA